MDSTPFDDPFLPAARVGWAGHPGVDLCQPALVLRLLLGVQAVVLAAALLAGAHAAGDLSELAVPSFGAMLATMAWLVGLCATKKVWQLATHRLRQAVVLAWGAGCAAGVQLALAWAGLVPSGGSAAAGAALAGVSAAAMAWSWVVLRARSRPPADTAARLAELQSRIRPHFLFNALNAAMALVRVDPVRAERVLEDLGELFRGALAESASEVSLEEEVELARRYLAIEQVRFGERLRVQWDIDPRVSRARLPPLVLQPLVENAVRHGVEPSATGADVSIKASLRQGQAVLEVVNTVPSGPRRPGRGMALANTAERLHLLHDIGAQCQAGPAGGHFRASISVPL